MLHPGMTCAGKQEAAGKQMISRLFEHRIRLTGKQRLIDLDRRIQHDTVRSDLHAALQIDDIIEHDLLIADLLLFPLAHDRGLRRDDQIQLGHHVARLDFLIDPQKRIGADDDDKKQARPCLDRHQCQRNAEIVCIKQIECMFNDDLAIALHDWFGREIDLPFPDA